MNSRAVYGDVVKDVISELQERIDAALNAGIRQENLMIDPGIGFAKDAHHNWEIIDSIDEFVALGYPVLVGGSRKRFLGGDNPDEREVAEAVAAGAGAPGGRGQAPVSDTSTPQAGSMAEMDVTGVEAHANLLSP